MKSSKDGGFTWENFQVISYNGWKGTYFNGCKGIYDRYRNNLLVQYAHFPPGGDEQIDVPKLFIRFAMCCK